MCRTVCVSVMKIRFVRDSAGFVNFLQGRASVLDEDVLSGKYKFAHEGECALCRLKIRCFRKTLFWKTNWRNPPFIIIKFVEIKNPFGSIQITPRLMLGGLYFWFSWKKVFFWNTLLDSIRNSCDVFVWKGERNRGLVKYSYSNANQNLVIGQIEWDKDCGKRIRWNDIEPHLFRSILYWSQDQNSFVKVCLLDV